MNNKFLASSSNQGSLAKNEIQNLMMKLFTLRKLSIHSLIKKVQTVVSKRVEFDHKDESCENAIIGSFQWQGLEGIF